MHLDLGLDGLRTSRQPNGARAALLGAVLLSALPGLDARADGLASKAVDLLKPPSAPGLTAAQRRATRSDLSPGAHLQSGSL